MKLHTITFTGVDDSVNSSELIDLSKQYPWVEFGILVSKNKYGQSFYPSKSWIETLISNAEDQLLNYNHQLKLSLHLTDEYVNDLLNGNFSILKEFPGILNFFQRVQINFGGQLLSFDENAFMPVLEQYPNTEFIFQQDGINDSLIDIARYYMVTATALYDKSFSSGTTPSEWPTPNEHFQCGFAGGLGPDNLDTELDRIAEKAGERDIWVCVESKLRTGNIFDLSKAATCITKANKYKPNNL